MTKPRTEILTKERLGLFPSLFCNLLILLSISCNCIGQAGFNLTYDIGKSIWLSRIEVINDNKIILNGVYYSDTSSNQNIILLFIDSNGIVSNVTEISDPLGETHLTFNKESDILISSDSLILIPFNFHSRQTMGIAFININGEIISIHEYPVEEGDIMSPYDILEGQDGFLITGWYSTPPNYITDAFVLKIDKHGNEKWFHEYGHPLYFDYGRTINQVNSNLILISGARYNHEPGLDFSHSWIIGIDSIGNKKMEWSSEENEILEIGATSLIYDSINHDIVYSSIFERQTLFPGKNYIVSVPVIVRRDSAMNLISYVELEPYAFNHYLGNLIAGNSTEILAVGNTTNVTDENFSDGLEFGQVYKLASDGSVIWQVTDTAFYNSVLGSRSYLSNLAIASSGSIYAVGWATNFNQDSVLRGYGWLLKISADGCVDTICSTSTIASQINRLQTSIAIFPNPASNEIKIVLLDEFEPPNYIDIFDITGKLCIHEVLSFKENKVTVLDLINGVYFWTVFNNYGAVQATGKLLVNRTF